MDIKSNSPDLWNEALPVKKDSGHKYDAGHAFIYAAPEMTGATRLAATACARMGVGLVTVLCKDDTYDIFRGSLPAHIIARNDLSYYHDKLSARLYGSGGMACKIDFGVDVPTVLDAAALKHLPETLSPHYILTPHEGEFAKTFPDISGDKENAARVAAQMVNAIIVLKGQKTVIAAPDGRVVVNTHASPYLATGGTGDVLAGMITGLLAQKMPSFEAACAGVWMHGEAGIALGAGLVASDIEIILPKILTMLHQRKNHSKPGFL
tara:strand:- start:56 stop:850 length:795 start_codon:yes stop_codon:yes gene_type:complete